MQFYQARDLIKKLIKRRLLFYLVLINNCKVKMFAKRSSAINSFYSGQQQFSYIIFVARPRADPSESPNVLHSCPTNNGKML